MNQAIVEKLQALHLNEMAKRYAVFAKEASRKNLTFEAYLEQLIDEELELKQQRSLERRTKEARFPSLNTLEQFDFTHPKKINKKLVLSLFDMHFVKDQEWIVFVGNSGLGKTHLAKVLGYRACQSGYRVLYTKTSHVVSALQAAVDRIIHRCQMVKIEGESYRCKKNT